MKIVTINFSEIGSHNSHRLDANYWIGKKEGKNAYKKVERGFFVEDDINGKEMFTEKDSDEYNKNILVIRRLKRKINKLTKSINL